MRRRHPTTKIAKKYIFSIFKKIQIKHCVDMLKHGANCSRTYTYTTSGVEVKSRTDGGLGAVLFSSAAVMDARRIFQGGGANSGMQKS